MLKSLLLIVTAMTWVTSDALGQTVDPTPRMAALRYALANGLVVQRDSVFVTWDPNGEPLNQAQLGMARDESRALAQLVGPLARDTAERSVLQCRLAPGDGGTRYGECVTTSRYAVVVVHHPNVSTRTDRLGVLSVRIEVLSPGFTRDERTRQSVAVNVSGAAGSWIGTGFWSPGVPGEIGAVRITPYIAAPNNLSGGARNALDDEQRQMESLAARYVAERDSSRHSFVGFGLDPRLYLLQWGKPASREHVYLSGRGTPHSPEHLATLAVILKTTGVIDDGSSCAVLRPSPCRMGSYEGALHFSFGLVKDDVAQLGLFRVSRRPPGRAEEAYQMVGWHFTFGKRAGEWTITGVRRS